LVSLQDVPITYSGAARHMVENALATCAAALGMGIAEHDVLAGLATFAPDPEHNAGRLNVFEIDGRTVIVDYAHNETGLLALIEFARARFPDRTSITAVIGTAGDRADEVFRGLGRIAARHADRILLKQNPGYLRGRNPDEMLELMAEGIRDLGAERKLAGIFPSEYDATFADLGEHRPQDVLVIMCVEDFRRVIDELQRLTAE
jgi:cyanophycin synthetase